MIQVFILPPRRQQTWPETLSFRVVCPLGVERYMNLVQDVRIGLRHPFGTPCDPNSCLGLLLTHAEQKVWSVSVTRKVLAVH